MKPQPIKDRIRKAYKPGISYHTLALKVFPPLQYPNSWNYALQGGPPACYRSLTKALKSMGAKFYNSNGSARDVYIPDEDG